MPAAATATASKKSLTNLFGLMQPKKATKGPLSIPPSYNPQSAANVLGAPQYQEHLNSLYDNRTALNSKDLLQQLFKQDPDVGAAVGSYLTLADTQLTMLVYDQTNQIDTNATSQLQQLITALFGVVDYTQGFQMKSGLQMACQEFRYMLMLRGAIAAELVFDKNYIPQRLQNVDVNTLQFFQTAPGVVKPRQMVPGTQNGVMLDIPSFFLAYHRRDPTQLYPGSDFVSCINTIAARQEVVNELYRIMRVSGFPRIAIKVLEEVLSKNAPADVKDDQERLNSWMQSQLSAVSSVFSNLRSDQAFAHFDSIEPSILNEKAPGMAVDISQVVNVLNAQNQASLKTMATVIGRGSGGVNTASVEARIAAMNADQLNVPLKQLLDQALTFLINSYGTPGFVSCTFAPAELRPTLELEPQKVLRASRLLQDLSLGIITDTEYHLQMHGRLPPAGAPQLSGTKFMQQSAGPTVDTQDVSPNSDPLGRSMAPEGGKMAKSNAVKNSLRAAGYSDDTLKLVLKMLDEADPELVE